MNRILLSSSLDDLRSVDMRFLEEAAKLGSVNVLLWSDEAVQAITGKAPKFPYAERLYFAQANRHVSNIQASGPQLAADWQADVQTMKDAGGYFFSLNRFVFVARKP